MDLEYMTIKECAERLRLSEATIARYIRDGKLDSIRFGHSRRLEKTSVEKFIRENAV